MYGIFTYMYHINQPNGGKYTIHGFYGWWTDSKWTVWITYVNLSTFGAAHVFGLCPNGVHVFFFCMSFFLDETTSSILKELVNYHLWKPKTKITPENQWLEDVSFPIEKSSLLRIRGFYFYWGVLGGFGVSLEAKDSPFEDPTITEEKGEFAKNREETQYELFQRGSI